MRVPSSAWPANSFTGKLLSSEYRSCFWFAIILMRVKLLVIKVNNSNYSSLNYKLNNMKPFKCNFHRKTFALTHLNRRKWVLPHSMRNEIADSILRLSILYSFPMWFFDLIRAGK